MHGACIFRKMRILSRQVSFCCRFGKPANSTAQLLPVTPIHAAQCDAVGRLCLLCRPRHCCHGFRLVRLRIRLCLVVVSMSNAATTAMHDGTRIEAGALPWLAAALGRARHLVHPLPVSSTTHPPSLSSITPLPPSPSSRQTRFCVPETKGVPLEEV